MHRNDKGTRWFFGKPYHYVLTGGVLSLRAGEADE